MRYELMFPSDYLRAADLIERGGEATVTIAEVFADDLHVRGKNGKTSTERKYVIRFNKAKKKLVLNKTNAKSIASQHGKDTAEWVGKEITLYATTCNAFGKTEDCIRVK